MIVKQLEFTTVEKVLVACRAIAERTVRSYLEYISFE
jgi:hypothetical protein